MATVLNPSYAPDTGVRSLSEMLGGFLTQMQQRGTTSRALEGIVGPQQANAISMLPPNMADTVLKGGIKSRQDQQQMAPVMQYIQDQLGIQQQGAGGQQPGAGQQGVENILSMLQPQAGAQPQGQQQGAVSPISYDEQGRAIPAQQQGVGDILSMLQPQAGQPDLASQLGGIGTQPGQMAQQNQIMDPLKAMMMSLGGPKAAQAVRALQESQKMVQKESLAERGFEQKKELAELSNKLKTFAGASASDRTEAKDTSEKIRKHRESERDMEDVVRLLDTGRVDTGLLFKFKDWADIAKETTSPETQLVAKKLAAEPIRLLAGLPGQAARLSKVFDTLNDMTPSLRNTEEGIRLIARARTADTKGARIYEEAKLDLMEDYRKRGKETPFNLDKEVMKKIQPRMDVINSEIERIVGESVGQKDPTNLAENFDVGFRAKWPQNNLPYVVTMVDGKKMWRPYKTKG